MNEIELYVKKLPDTMEDISRFVLIGREKYNSVRAEIRAIEKLKLMDEVLKQKREEAVMLAETILDAEVRLGELFKQIPKKAGKRTDIELRPGAGTRFEKSKEETIADLGFSKTQAYSMETLADNPDIVEYVKTEAHENNEFPSRTRILELAALKNKQKNEDGVDGNYSETACIIYMDDYQAQQEKEIEEYEKFIDLRVQVYKELCKINELIIKFTITPYRMEALRDNFDAVITIDEEINHINDAIAKLNRIKLEIQKGKKFEKRK